VTVSHTRFELDLALLGWVAVSDQRSLLLGRLASAIDGAADVAAQLAPPAAQPASPPPPAAPAGRPWTVAAATEPISAALLERVGDSGLLPAVHLSDTFPPAGPAHHRFPAIVGTALIGLAVILVITLRVLPAPPAAPTAVTGEIALTAVRPVASSNPAGGLLPPTQISFPAGTSTVSIVVNSGGPAGHAPVEIRVSVGQPAQTLIDREFVLDASGTTLIPLSPASGPFAPGNYRVTIISNGATVGSTAFEVR
jgi:hypothetical protein